MEWVSEKSTGLMWLLVAVLFVAFAFLYDTYRYVHICVAIVAFVFACKQLRKRNTPFERREREIRRKNM